MSQQTRVPTGANWSKSHRCGKAGIINLVTEREVLCPRGRVVRRAAHSAEGGRFEASVEQNFGVSVSGLEKRPRCQLWMTAEFSNSNLSSPRTPSDTGLAIFSNSDAAPWLSCQRVGAQRRRRQFRGQRWTEFWSFAGGLEKRSRSQLWMTAEYIVERHISKNPTSVVARRLWW